MKLNALNEALDNAQFADFWTKVKESKDLVANVPDFEAQARESESCFEIFSNVSRHFHCFASNLQKGYQGYRGLCFGTPRSFLFLARERPKGGRR